MKSGVTGKGNWKQGAVLVYTPSKALRVSIGGKVAGATPNSNIAYQVNSAGAASVTWTGKLPNVDGLVAVTGIWPDITTKSAILPSLGIELNFGKKPK
jgi:hypothetical protein